MDYACLQSGVALKEIQPPPSGDMDKIKVPPEEGSLRWVVYQTPMS